MHYKSSQFVFQLLKAAKFFNMLYYKTKHLYNTITNFEL